MEIRVKLFLFVLFFFVFSGCGDEVSNEQAELNTKIAEIKCGKEFECCNTSMKPKHYETIEECVRYNEILSAESIDYLEFSNYTWNKENAEKCLEYWNSFSMYSYSCEEDINVVEAGMSEETKEKMDELKSACSGLLKGSVGIGAKCYPDLSNGDGCSEGLTCSDKTYECEKTPRLGESCVDIEECYTDLEKEIYCDKVYKKDKDGNNETDTDGNYIVESATCKHMPVIGEDCSNTKDCDNNLEEVFCEIIYKKDSEGDYEYDEDTGDRILVSATCKKLPEKGKNCELSKRCYKEDEGEIYCAEEEDEDGNSEYFCREYPKVNMPCNENGECAEGLICKYEEGDEGDYSEICLAKSKEGAVCENTDECEDDLFCKIEEDAEDSKCAKKLPEGSACIEDFHCLSGECFYSEEASTGYCLDTTLADQICIQYDYGDEYLF